MKIIYSYNYLDRYGKPQYQKIEISEEDEQNWIISDYERRVSEASNEEKELVKPRTLQEYMDKLNAEAYNQDRKHRYHEDMMQTIKDEDGNEISNIDNIASDEPTSEEKMIEEERQNEINKKVSKALSILSETQRRRVIKRFVDQMTLQEIADEEGVHFTVIDESIKAALKKIQKNFRKHP